MKKQVFIKTSDEHTQKLLCDEGFKLVDYSNGIWTFLNDQKMTFGDDKKVAYSNMLTI